MSSVTHVTHAHTEAVGKVAQVLESHGHTLRADATPDDGGDGSAPGPHDLFDASLAACMTLTAHWYARHKKIPLERVTCTLERDDSGERAKPPEEPVYRLRARLTFEGDLTDDQRAALLRAADHCPVAKLMTKVVVQIETTVETAAISQ